MLFSPPIPTNMNQINQPFHNFHKNIPGIRKAISINKRFWITILSATIFLALLQRGSASNQLKIIVSLLSLIIAATVGWMVHLFSHSFDFTQILTHIQNNSNTLTYIFKIIPPFKFIAFALTNQLDFHHKIHHNTDINKQPTNLIIEFIQNILTQGLLLAILLRNLGITINAKPGKSPLQFNYATMIMYAFLYATVHIINYNLDPSICHEQHHANEKTNLGIDFLDVIFNHKYDPSCIEHVNHYAINISIICLIIYFLYKHINPKHPVSTFLFGKQ